MKANNEDETDDEEMWCEPRNQVVTQQPTRKDTNSRKAK
jgi:hypothetical protein